MIHTLKKIKLNETILVIKEFYNIYCINNFFSENKIYKVKKKNEKKETINIIIFKNIDEISAESIVEILEEYNDKDVIFVNPDSLNHSVFYEVFRNLDLLYFNWSQKRFLYKDKKSGSHFNNNHENLKLIYYLKYKIPFIPTPNTITPAQSILERECSYFPT